MTDQVQGRSRKSSRSVAPSLQDKSIQGLSHSVDETARYLQSRESIAKMVGRIAILINFVQILALLSFSSLRSNIYYVIYTHCFVFVTVFSIRRRLPEEGIVDKYLFLLNEALKPTFLSFSMKNGTLELKSNSNEEVDNEPYKVRWLQSIHKTYRCTFIMSWLEEYQYYISHLCSFNTAIFCIIH